MTALGQLLLTLWWQHKHLLSIWCDRLKKTKIYSYLNSITESMLLLKAKTAYTAVPTTITASLCQKKQLSPSGTLVSYWSLLVVSYLTPQPSLHKQFISISLYILISHSFPPKTFYNLISLSTSLPTQYKISLPPHFYEI